MAFGHLLGTYRRILVPYRAAQGGSGSASVGLVHLVGMGTDSDTAAAFRSGLEPVLTLSELAADVPGSRPDLRLLYRMRTG